MTQHVETAKPMAKRPKDKPTANSKGNKNARLISRMARNKPKIPVNPDPIMVSENSDPEIERYLASKYPYSEGLCDKPSYYFHAYKMILIIQASKCLVKPLVTRLNPLLLQPKQLLHHVISVAHGWKGITSTCHCSSPEFMLWKIKLQGSPARRQRCHPLIKNSEQQVRFCLRMWSLLQRL
jgi:hypothetical protein